MNAPLWIDQQAALTLERILPQLEPCFRRKPERWMPFQQRLRQHFPTLFGLLFNIYGSRYDLHYHLACVLHTLAEAAAAREKSLCTLDAAREADPGWHTAGDMIGATGYVDRLAGDLPGLIKQLPYLEQLGVRYVHLLPLFACPDGENDGGYAVSDYRAVDPRLGSIDDLRKLARQLRKKNMSLALDFIFNHTSSEHAWARAARAGDAHYQDFYLTFPDRHLPDQYSAHLRDIFPDVRPGCFHFDEGMQRWVWSTFHNYQWDLNYANPQVFTAMAGELLFLANLGVEVIRLDAVAFLWKQIGTSCENLPQAHWLIQAFNCMMRIAAPAVAFKSEAIVHPDEVARYICQQECQISYNPSLSALLWESLATRQTTLLQNALHKYQNLAPDCSWVNFVRVHDDIGWTFSDEDAAGFGIDGYSHRQFLNRFYTGNFPGSFALGVPFQYNPRNGDCRVCGTTASLAGLEQALDTGNTLWIEHALRRIELLYSMCYVAGGIPLIYLGDELAALNDYSYLEDPDLAQDARWAHRGLHRPERLQQSDAHGAAARRVFAHLQKLARLRQRLPALGTGRFSLQPTESSHLLAFWREDGQGGCLIVANFSEHEVELPSLPLPAGHVDWLGDVTNALPMSLPAYAVACFAADQ